LPDPAAVDALLSAAENALHPSDCVERDMRTIRALVKRAAKKASLTTEQTERAQALPLPRAND